MCLLQDFPTDMPLSGRGLLRNKDGKMKAYMSKLNNIKILPAAAAEDSTRYVDLLVEEERVPVPYVQKNQIEKIQLDKGKIERYLDVLSLEERPSTIKLDQSRIFGYIMELASTQEPEQQVYYKPRIKLLKAAAQGSIGGDGETYSMGTLRLPRDVGEEVEEMWKGQPLGEGGSGGQRSQEDGFEEYGGASGKNDYFSGFEGELCIGGKTRSDGLYRRSRDTSLDSATQTNEEIELMNDETKKKASINEDVGHNLNENTLNEVYSLNCDLTEDKNIKSLEDSEEVDKTGSLANLNNELSNLPSNNNVQQNISKLTEINAPLSVNSSPIMTNINDKNNIQVSNPNIANPTKRNDMSAQPTNENVQQFNPASQNSSVTFEKNKHVSGENDSGLRNVISSIKNVSNAFQPSTVTNDYHPEAQTEIISKPSQNLQNPLYNKSNPSNAVKNVINITANLNGNQNVPNAPSTVEEKLVANEIITTEPSKFVFNPFQLGALDPSGIHDNTKLTGNFSNLQNMLFSKPSNKSQDGLPNMYNTVLDIMGMDPNKFFENTFPSNVSSLSIHIFGPDITKSLANESWPNNLLTKLQEIIMPNTNEAFPMISQDTLQNHTKVEASNNDIASNVVKDSYNKVSTVAPQINGKLEGENNLFDQQAEKIDVTPIAPVTAVPPAEVNSPVFENHSPQAQSQGSTCPEIYLDNKVNESSYSAKDKVNLKHEDIFTSNDFDPFRPTKPPEMFDSYYNFIRREIMRHNKEDSSKVDATNEHELYKVFQNLEGINADKGSLFKAIGRAVEGVENEQGSSPPKWVEGRKEEAELASHMGQRAGPQVRDEGPAGGPPYPQGMLKMMERDPSSKKRSVKTSATPQVSNIKSRKNSNNKQNPDILFPLKS